VAGWSSDQLITFLEKLCELRALQPLHASTSQAMAALYGLLATKNAEIRSAYYKLAITAEDTQVLGPCVELLQTQVGVGGGGMVSGAQVHG
jgi:leukotriene-A4 hydrolase